MTNESFETRRTAVRAAPVVYGIGGEARDAVCTDCARSEVRRLKGWPTYYCEARRSYMTRTEAVEGPMPCNGAMFAEAGQ